MSFVIGLVDHRIISHKGTVASFSSSTLVLVVDGDELTFDITGATRDYGTLAQDAEVKIEAEDSPDGLVAITVTVKDAGEEDLGTAGMLVRRIAVAIGIFGGLAIAWPFFWTMFPVGVCDAASCPSQAVLLAWEFSLPIVGVTSVIAGILAPRKPVSSAKTFFVAAALYFVAAVLGPVSVGEGLGRTAFPFAIGIVAPLSVISLAMGRSLLRWGVIGHEIPLLKASARTLIKVAAIYLMAAVLSLFWFELFLFGEHANAPPGLLAFMSAIGLVIGATLFAYFKWGRP